MNYKAELNQRVELINNMLMDYLPEENGLQKIIMKAMNYSMMAGGKRLRPMLMIETYRLFGGKEKIIEPFMVAMEMIQTYSLVHDDLPPLDNDDYRRGRKSTHAMFGENIGILAGDALLNYAFEVASSAFEIEISNKTAKAIQILAKKAGIYGMVGGQVVDVESEGINIPFETLQFIHQKKCGALIEASMMIGAILAGASEEEVAKVEQAGASIGLAFQIQDDILDVTSTTEILGKPVGSDNKNNKVTYITFLGIENSKQEVINLSNQAIDILKSFSTTNEFLFLLIHNMINRIN